MQLRLEIAMKYSLHLKKEKAFLLQARKESKKLFMTWLILWL